MRSKLIMIQGTSSGAGKSTLVTALCRIFSDMGYSVTPFKAQNMSSKLYHVGSKVMAQAQAIQAVASRKKPEVAMNPVLLEPMGNYVSKIYLNGVLNSEMIAFDYYRNFVLQKAFPEILKSLRTLMEKNEIIIMEGAGSPAEVNIAQYDVANMVLALKVRSPVIIVADIERGGCFASIVGTTKLLSHSSRNLVKGFVINKFLGDRAILEPAIEVTEKITRKKILGIIPKLNFNLPDEDSLDASAKKSIPQDDWDDQINLLSTFVRANIDIKRILEVARISANSIK